MGDAGATRGVVGATAGVKAASAFVGREAEIAAVLGALEEQPALVLIEGEAGIGKTRLVAELASRPEVSGRRWVAGGCRRIREPFPLAPLIEAVRGLEQELRTAQLSPVTGALRPLLPEVAELLPAQPAPLGDRVAERHRVFRGLVEVFGSLGSAVLVLEDLHWADEQSVEFVSYLLAECPSQLCVVLTFRGEEVDPGVRASTVKLPASVRRIEVGLRPLDAAQTGMLAASILDTDHVSEEFAAHMCARASGVPFAVEELLALLSARGSLTRTAAGWARRAIDELDVPSGTRDLVLERVSRISDEARSVVEAAAVLQAPSSILVLVEVCRADGSQALRGVEDALASGLLVEDGDAVSFRHVLAAQAVYDAMVGPQRTDLHSRAASGLERIDPVPLGQLAHHLRHAGREREWASAAEQAADQAVALGDDEEAASLLDDVIRHASLDTEQQGRVAVKLARAVAESGYRSHELIGPLSTVLEQAQPASVHGELAFWLALMIEKDGGDPALQRRLYARAVADLDDRPALKAWAMMGLAIAKAPGVPPTEYKQWVERVLETLPAVDDPVFEVFLLGKGAAALAEWGDPAWRQLTERILEQTGETPRELREASAYRSVGSGACYLGHHESSDRLLTLALGGALHCESSQLQLRIRVGRALLDYFRGAWDGLGDTVEFLLDEFADFPAMRVCADLVAGCLELAHGDVREAQDRLIELTQPLEDMGEFDGLGVAVGALARLAVVRGDVGGAVERVRRFMATVESYGLWVPVARALPAVVHVLVTAGRSDEAHTLVARASRELEELDTPLAPAALRHAQGLLDAAEQQWAAAAEHLLTAARLYDSLPCPYEAAQAREQAGMAMFAGGDGAAEEKLRAALTTYRRLGASWDAARCMRAARRHGVRIPVLHRRGRKGYGESLSPRESEVARLAATGLSNKEIATELYLSPRTVSSHLSKAMRKLGVHSRAAIAAQLADRSHRGLGVE